MAVRLAARISDKIQSNIWANEYFDFGTLLQRSYAIDSKYNFIVQASPSADRPVISLEPAQKPKHVYSHDRSMDYSLSNLCSDLYCEVSKLRTRVNEA